MRRHQQKHEQRLRRLFWRKNRMITQEHCRACRRLRAWRIRQDFLIEKLTGVEKNIEVVEVNSIVVFFGACTALIYAIIFIDNSRRCYQLRRIIRSQDSDDDKIQLVSALVNLQALQRDTLGRILASPLLFVSFWPNIMFIAYGLSGFLHTDHEKHDLVGNIREA